MTKARMNKLYFDWMYDLVCPVEYTNGRSYRELLRYLNSIDFTYTIPMDGNRAEDGIDLRYRFGYECGHDDLLISNFLDIYPCSVLEMMVALSIRCEDRIMEDPDFGNRTGQWFWTMINNLELDSMTDEYFDDIYVDIVITRLLNREYEPNGEGGLITVDNGYDMRSVDIWYQMCYYLDEIV